MHLIYKWMLPIIVTFVAVSHAAGQPSVTQMETKPDGDKITVKGILLNKDKSPAAGKQVFVLESQNKGKFILVFGLDGKIANQAKVGKHGDFVISINRTFLESRQAVLCVLLKSGITPQYPNGTPIIVKSPSIGSVVDLGEIVITQ